MDSSLCSRRHCFIKQDNGLASIAVMETGYSRSDYKNHNQNGFFSRPLTTSLRNLSSTSSSFSFYTISSPRFEDPQPHFLDSCFLCKKSIQGNKDIFMYRGDTPFCSEDCRQEQIEIDEAKEKNQRSLMKAMMKKDKKKYNSPTKPQNYPFRPGTIAAA